MSMNGTLRGFVLLLTLDQWRIEGAPEVQRQSIECLRHKRAEKMGWQSPLWRANCGWKPFQRETAKPVAFCSYPHVLGARAHGGWVGLSDMHPLSGCVFRVPLSLLRRKGVYGEKSLSGLRTNLLPEDLREKVRRSIFISSWKETSSNRCVHLGCGIRRAVCMGKVYLSITSLWTPGFHLPEVSPASRMTPRGQVG